MAGRGRTLLLVVELNGPTMMMARIGMLRALNRNVERVFNPSRKDTQWGKRKLKRDQMSRHEKPGKKAGLIANML